MSILSLSATACQARSVTVFADFTLTGATVCPVSGRPGLDRGEQKVKDKMG